MSEQSSGEAFHYRIHDDPVVFTVSDTAAEAAEKLEYDVTGVFCSIGTDTERGELK